MKIKRPEGRRSPLWFHCEGRWRHVFKPQPGAHFHIRFEVRGKGYLRSLGTMEASLAVEKAKRMISAAVQGDEATLRESRLRSEYAPLPEIGARYEKFYGTNADRRKIARGNFHSLCKIVRVGAGMNPLAARANLLDDALIRKFEAEELERVPRDAKGNMDRAAELRARTSIESVITQARAVFRKSRMNCFDGLVLPDLTKFREQGFERPDRPKPSRLDLGVMDAINADAPRLARENPALYATFLLFSQCGLRNKEIWHARRWWIHRNADGSGVIDITKRPEEGFDPKGSEGTVPISAPVLAALLEIAEPEEAGGYLVPAANRTARRKIVDREHSQWVGQWIKDRSKTSYELRRYAGSLYFDQVGDILKVRDFLRHKDVSTTMKWYWYRMRDLKPLAAPAWMQPLAVVQAVA